MNLTEQDIEKFKQENKSLMESFETINYRLPQRLDEAELIVSLLRDAGEASRKSIELHARTAGAMASAWVDERSDWELGLTQQQSTEQRKEFVAACFKNASTPEFVEDGKKRWALAQFTSVSPSYLVIGDAWVRRRGDKLPLKEESDLVSQHSDQGRETINYEEWQEMKKKNEILAVRPKINGERFVLVSADSKKKLVGFKEIEVPYVFRPQVVEYYAGKYYCIFPYIQTAVYYQVKEQGVKKTIEILPHPFLTPHEFFVKREAYFSHKYDGVMLWTGEREYRAKWKPTVEVEILGEVWEVSLGAQRDCHRPRYGKHPTHEGNVNARIRAQVQGKHLIPFFEHMMTPDDPMRDIAQSVAQDSTQKVLYSGSKCLFVDEKTERIFLIREPGKGLDLIGGRAEEGETPMITMIREVQEETGSLTQPDDYTYVGPSLTEGEATSWVSHCYIARAPEQVMSHKHVESYAVKDLKYFVGSKQGMPRQIWLSRLFDHISKRFPSIEDLSLALSMRYGVALPNHRELPKLGQTIIYPYYLVHLRRLQQEHEALNQSVPFTEYLYQQGGWMDEWLTKELSIVKKFELLEYPKKDAEVLPFVKHMFRGRMECTRKVFDNTLRFYATQKSAEYRDRFTGLCIKNGIVIAKGQLLSLTGKAPEQIEGLERLEQDPRRMINKKVKNKQ